MPTAVRLDTDYRTRSWQRLREEAFDVLVIGGGVTGAGVALDAATRGLSVALVEQGDFASGTSSRSSKLFHGGLRYLEQMNFRLVREALRERELMLTKIAPHLVKPVSFLYPLTHRVWERPYVSAGLTIYDSMGGAKSVPRHRQLSRTGALKLAPALRRDSVAGALLYFDAQVDDARHTMTVARTAASYGATILSSVKVIQLTRSGERVTGAIVVDRETGEEATVHARAVVNCAGVWTNALQGVAKGRQGIGVSASKGIHVVIPRDKINSQTGLILRTKTSVLFVVPWANHWIIGTTDTPWTLDKAHPSATRTDITYLLDQVNTVLATPLTHDDVRGVYVGLRPLISGELESPSRISREHAAVRTQPGLVTVAGGKYTTYRVMAADGVDAAREDLGPIPDSVTSEVPLVGAEGYHAVINRANHLAAETGLPATQVIRLINRYGSLVTELLDLAQIAPSFLRPLGGAEDYLGAEALYAVTHEGALHLDDVLTRRTRISIETDDRGVRAATAVAQIVAPVLAWDETQTNHEISAYTRRVEAERQSQEVLGDEGANAQRLAAPDIRDPHAPVHRG